MEQLWSYLEMTVNYSFCRIKPLIFFFLHIGKLGEPNTEARITDKFTALVFKEHFSSYTTFISKAYIHKMDNNWPVNSSHFVKISNILADYKFLLNTSTNLQTFIIYYVRLNVGHTADLKDISVF